MTEQLRPIDYNGHVPADPLEAWTGVLAEFTTTLRDVLATLSRIEARMEAGQ